MNIIESSVLKYMSATRYILSRQSTFVAYGTHPWYDPPPPNICTYTAQEICTMYVHIVVQVCEEECFRFIVRIFAHSAVEFL